MQQQSKMVNTTDYWFPNINRNKVLVTVMSCKIDDSRIILIVRGDDEFALKKFFPLDNSEEAQQAYNDMVDSDPRIDDCYAMGFVDYIDRQEIKTVAPAKDSLWTACVKKIRQLVKQ